MQIVKPDAVTTTGSVTRTGVATYYDQDGLVKVAASGELRFGHDPTNLEFAGLIIEDASTNYARYSEEFNNTGVWSANLSTVAPNAGTSPSGAVNADRWTSTTGSTAHFLAANFNYVAGKTFTFSIWVKSSTAFDQKFQLFHLGSAAVEYTASPTKWQRFSHTVTADTTTASPFGISRDSLNNPSDLYVWGAQIEESSKMTSYIPTTSAPVTRNAEVITGSGLLYTNVTNPHAAWSSSTTYALGATVVVGNYTGSNVVDITQSGTYKSLTNSNLNNNPLTSPTNWVRLGPTNQFAMFDNVVSSVSSSTSDITFVLDSTSVDSIAVLNVIANKIAVAVSDHSYSQSYQGNLAYYRTTQLSGTESVDWYSYFFFDEETQKTQALYLDIPQLPDGIITIKITGTGTVSAGSIITGQIKELGQTQYGVSTGIIDYSRKETDEFGNTSLVVRNYSKRMNAKIFLTNNNLNRVQRLLYSVRATPVLWIGSTDLTFEEPLVVMGYYKDFDTEIAYPAHSLCNITVDGLI